MIQVPVDISLEYLQFVLLLLKRGGGGGFHEERGFPPYILFHGIVGCIGLGGVSRSRGLRPDQARHERGRGFSPAWTAGLRVHWGVSLE